MQGDPIENLVEAYLTQSMATASCYCPMGNADGALVDAVRQNHAEGVIFCAPSFCDPALLEQPMLVDQPWSANTFPTPNSSTPRIRDNLPSSANRQALSRIPSDCGARHDQRHLRALGIDRAERAEHGPAKGMIGGHYDALWDVRVQEEASCIHVCSRQFDRTAAILRSASGPS